MNNSTKTLILVWALLLLGVFITGAILISLWFLIGVPLPLVFSLLTLRSPKSKKEQEKRERKIQIREARKAEKESRKKLKAEQRRQLIAEKEKRKAIIREEKARQEKEYLAQIEAKERKIKELTASPNQSARSEFNPYSEENLLMVSPIEPESDSPDITPSLKTQKYLWIITIAASVSLFIYGGTHPSLLPLLFGLFMSIIGGIGFASNWVARGENEDLEKGIDSLLQKLSSQEEVLARKDNEYAKAKEDIEALHKIIRLDEEQYNDLLREKARIISKHQKATNKVRESIKKIRDLQKVIDAQNEVLSDDEKLGVEFNLQWPSYKSVLEFYEREIDEKGKKVEELKKEIFDLEDTQLLQSFSLYKPKYDLMTSEEYKNTLHTVREEQKSMVRENVAVTCAIDLPNRTTKNVAKAAISAILMAFNAECDDQIPKVKFNTYAVIEAHLTRVYTKLNSLFPILSITISQQYFNLKIAELSLVHEYEQKKKEEKEYARYKREIERENAKVQKEYEEKLESLEKEKRHYENYLRALRKQASEEQNLAKREIIQDKIDATSDELDEIRKGIRDVESRQANQRAGYVYVISNLGSFGEDVYKIGMTRRLNPKDRVDELGGASVPFRFDIHALIFSENAPGLEASLHNKFAEKRVNLVNGRKEFYKVSLNEIEEAVKSLGTEYQAVSFTHSKEAEQYRESLLLREQNILPVWRAKDDEDDIFNYEWGA